MKERMKHSPESLKSLQESLKAITTSDYTSGGELNAKQAGTLLNWTLSDTAMLGGPWGEVNGPYATIKLTDSEKGEYHAMKFTGDALKHVTESTTSITENKPSFDKVNFEVEMFQAAFDITRRSILDSVAAPKGIPGV